MRYKNLGEMFFSKRQEFPEKIAYQFKEGEDWVSVSYSMAIEKAETIAAGLASLGVKKGDRVAIISPNCIDWALTDYATLALGALLVPIYPSLMPDQIAYILNDSEAKVLVAADQTLRAKIDSIFKDLKYTNYFYTFNSSDQNGNTWKSFKELQSEGEQFLKNNKNFVQEQIENVETSDWATIIYTSGTTGEPKGAILTHKNFLSNIEGALQILIIHPEDTFLSFLPLSHIFERMAGHYLTCYKGCTVAYAESIDTVAQNLLEIKPTIMISVPRLYEKIYARVIDSVESGPGLKRKIFYWAIKVGKEYINKVMYNKKVSAFLNIKNKIAHKLVFSKLHERVGGRSRFFVSGGAPLSPEIAEFFGAVGIKILEGYGLTETSPVIAVNHLESFKFGSVGHVLPNVEVKIAEDGEILSRGDHIMVGYFKKENETRDSIDEDGWFHTGDIGLIDEDNFLKITDRKKNIIVTSGGKNIAPQPIENSLITSSFIEHSIVIGDKRKFCTAVLVPAEEALRNWAKEKGEEPKEYADLISLNGVRELYRSEIDRLTKNLASYETIKDFIFADQPFTIESGELTPSLKVKRNIVEINYKRQIDKMYDV